MSPRSEPAYKAFYRDRKFTFNAYKGSSAGFIGVDNIGLLPEGDWVDFLAAINSILRSFRIEILPREPLVQPAPVGIEIPTVFDGPYYIFDTLFYWAD